MEFLKYWPQVCLAFLCLIFLAWYLKQKSQAIYHWPFLGALPLLLWNSNRILEWMTDIFTSLDGRCSFFVNGPVISKLSYLVTCHPKNIEYIVKTNFSNFPKGSYFSELFSIFGKGVINVDDESWRSQRKMAHTCFSSIKFRSHVAKSSKNIILDSLVPFLTHVARQGHTIDLQEVCKRFAFDTIMSTTFGRDERSLCPNLSANEFADAVDVALEAILHRHTMPMFFWKFLRWLRVGNERRLSKAQRTIDVLLGEYISTKKESLLETNDMFATYSKSLDDFSKIDAKLLRDEMFTFLVAGRDTVASGLVWFLWSVAKAPHVEAKILEELKLVASMKKNNDTKNSHTKPRLVFEADDLKRLVYLHAALCESLRLYPPLPLISKAVINEDVLPDGTVVKPGVQIILSIYCEGKMPWIWGEDSLEFKPERWIDDDGKLSHKPLSKFFTFNIGPRTCLGKDITFTVMKCAVAAILFNFQVELVQGQQVAPKPALTLDMKNGLMVKIIERATV